MNYTCPHAPGAASGARRSKGVALVIVLAFLVLLSILVVAFLTSVTADLNDSKGYEAEVNTRMLADSAVNLVIGEIRTASTGTGVAWVSQPGLIRTYDTAGAPVRAYKLYSSGSMIVTGSFNPGAAGDLPQSTAWFKQPNLWVDMNSPVTVVSGNTSVAVFPIIDGNGMGTNAFTMSDGTTSAYSYTSDGSTQDIQGFYTNPPAAMSSYNPSQPPSGSNNPIPMPVQWLYMLKDGTLLSATSAGANTSDAGIVDPNGALASGTNPIVARIAFWTDDESAKVNINTASEGTFWDTPVCNSENSAGNPQDFDVNNIYEWDLAERMGDTGEYQRYPGHPATTCLSPILGPSIERNLFGSNLTGSYGNPVLTGTQRAQFTEAIYELIPRITGTSFITGGTAIDYTSEGGTRRAGLPGQSATASGTYTTAYPVITDTDRLYATTDELIYNLSRNLQTTLSGTYVTGATPDPRPLVEKGRFFLTASSKSPETNLFNLPRVAIWPITRGAGTINSSPDDVSKMTPFDKLLAFCSTVSSKNEDFYFSREDPKSATTDWGTRNAQIYSYLQKMTSRAIPGFGGNFSAKYGNDTNQILTEIFDYIRCTNLVDTSGDAPNAATSNAYTQPASVNSGMVGNYNQRTTRGQVVPINPGNGTRGFGRIATISEMTLAITRATTNPIQDGTSTTFQIVLIPSIYCPMAGFSALANDIRLRFSNFNIRVKRVSDPDVPASWQNPFTGPVSDVYDTGRIGDQQNDESKIGGAIGIRTLVEGGSPVPAPSDSMFPVGQVVFSGDFASLPTNQQFLQIADSSTTGTAAGFDVNISAPAGTSTSPGPVIQTFHFAFPTYNAGNRLQLPMPTASFTFPLAGQDKSGVYSTWPRILQFMQGPIPQETWRAAMTTVRSLAPLGSFGSGTNNMQFDMRTLACTGTVPAATFMPVGFTTAPYFDSTRLMVHSIRISCLNRQASQGNSYDQSPAMGPMQGSFLKGPSIGYSSSLSGTALSAVTPVKFDSASSMANSNYNTRPLVPAGVNGVFNVNGDVGDWDNGSGFLGDGSYLGKADEGTDRHVDINGGYDNSGSTAPYIGYSWVSEDSGAQQNTFFSPNRQIASPAVFGSLPTGVLRGLPWQTLLFRPAKSYFPGGNKHPGAGQPYFADGTVPHPPYTVPPDHLLLDLFWMPVVEPYPISEPFATAGKINMNYQIAPFTYIRRDTGVRAVLQSVKITALDPNLQDSSGENLAQKYKMMGSPYDGGISVRRNIDIDKTFLQFDSRFANNAPFISASEICDIALVPGTMSQPGNANYLNVNVRTLADVDAQLANFWNGNSGKQSATNGFTGVTGNWLTGDNSLERPYALIYPRLTTKSNTYTVHVRVQSLKKVRDTPYNVFKDGQDQVAGEFRGSFLIERYLDPANTGFVVGSGTVNSANNENTFNAQLGPYKFRIISSKQFTP